MEVSVVYNFGDPKVQGLGTLNFYQFWGSGEHCLQSGLLADWLALGSPFDSNY